MTESPREGRAQFYASGGAVGEPVAGFPVAVAGAVAARPLSGLQPLARVELTEDFAIRGSNHVEKLQDVSVAVTIVLTAALIVAGALIASAILLKQMGDAPFFWWFYVCAALVIIVVPLASFREPAWHGYEVVMMAAPVPLVAAAVVVPVDPTSPADVPPVVDGAALDFTVGAQIRVKAFRVCGGQVRNAFVAAGDVTGVSVVDECVIELTARAPALPKGIDKICVGRRPDRCSHDICVQALHREATVWVKLLNACGNAVVTDFAIESRSCCGKLEL